MDARLGHRAVGPDYTIGPIDPALAPAHHTPLGRYFQLTLPLNGSKYYDCTAATQSATFNGHGCLPSREVAVYVPAAYVDGDEAAVLVSQDGPFYDQYLIQTMDALILHPDPSRSLPPFIAISVSTGTKTDGTGSLRDIQYDTVSGKYAGFVADEIFGAVLTNPEIRSAYPRLRFTSDPTGRLSLGCSSGAAAGFSMAWFRPGEC
jgi:iron(III)-enterobactin esterase